MGRLEGKSKKQSAPPATANDEGGVEGEYGQQIN
jgi:hypothetical protein